MGHYEDMDILCALASAAKKLGYSTFRLVAFKGDDVFNSLHMGNRKGLCYIILPHAFNVFALRLTLRR